MTWEPIDNHSPYKRIDIAPRAPVTQAEAKTFWEIQAEADEARRRLERAEKVWRAVVASAEASNMSVRPAEPGIPVSESAEPVGAVGDPGPTLVAPIWDDPLRRLREEIESYEQALREFAGLPGHILVPESAPASESWAGSYEGDWISREEAEKRYGVSDPCAVTAEPEKRTTGHGCETGAGFNTDDWSARYREAAEQLWRNREGE